MGARFHGTTPERRAVTRAALQTRATVHLANQEFTCLTRDVSLDGLALAGHDSTPPPGTFMRVHLQLPNDDARLDLDGILVRTEPRNSGIVWGLKLIGGETMAQTRIRTFVDAHRGSPPSPTQEHQQTIRRGSGFTSIDEGAPGTLAMPPGPSARTHPDSSRSPGSEAQPPSRRQVSDSQFYELYEESLSQASWRRSLTSTTTQPRTQTPERLTPSARQQRASSWFERSRRHKASGSTTELDVELYWLYEKATNTLGSSSEREGDRPRRGLSRGNRKPTR